MASKRATTDGTSSFGSNSQFYVLDKTLDSKKPPLRRAITDTGTIHTNAGHSNFYKCKPMESPVDDVVQTRTLTGSTVTSCGYSNFYSKPDQTVFNRAPPNIISHTSPLQRTGTVKFPQMKEFSHFHYDKTEVPNFQCTLKTESEPAESSFLSIVVTSDEKTWVVQRQLNDFVLLDKQIHYCLMNRVFSQLRDLSSFSQAPAQEVKIALNEYLQQFSSLSGCHINCGTVLNFFEMNSKGGHLISPNAQSAINIPAVAAAIVIKQYEAQAPDELNLKVGDLISVIDKPPAAESTWWRGKKELQVGFFPSECVELIGVRKSVQPSAGRSPSIPIAEKRGKVIAFLRDFFIHRPSKQALQQSGIIKERVFGADLGEYLMNGALAVPTVLNACTVVIEQHGIVDGIYRLSGVTSHIQALRDDFDSERQVVFSDEVLLDVHTISSLLKLYFRELPNPLLTYSLYLDFVDASKLPTIDEQVEQLRAIMQMLPPPHYRTADTLFKHLHYMSSFERRTGMTSRNLAIVWAPNLMRYRDEYGTLSGLALLQGVGQQAAVVDLLISNYSKVFISQSVASPCGKRKQYDVQYDDRLKSLTTARRERGLLSRKVAIDKTQAPLPNLQRSISRSVESFFPSESEQSKLEKYPEVKVERRRPVATSVLHHLVLSTGSMSSDTYEDPATTNMIRRPGSNDRTDSKISRSSDSPSTSQSSNSVSESSYEPIDLGISQRSIAAVINRDKYYVVPELSGMTKRFTMQSGLSMTAGPLVNRSTSDYTSKSKSDGRRPSDPDDSVFESQRFVPVPQPRLKKLTHFYENMPGIGAEKLNPRNSHHKQRWSIACVSDTSNEYEESEPELPAEPSRPHPPIALKPSIKHKVNYENVKRHGDRMSSDYDNNISQIRYSLLRQHASLTGTTRKATPSGGSVSNPTAEETGAIGHRSLVSIYSSDSLSEE